MLEINLQYFGGRGASSGGENITQTQLSDGGYMLRTPNGVAMYHILTQGNEKFIYLDEIRTSVDVRNKGEGTQLLNAVKSTADKQNLPVKLDAFPIGKGAMSVDNLIKWYEKRGFKHVGANQMVYNPRKK